MSEPRISDEQLAGARGIIRRKDREQIDDERYLVFQDLLDDLRDCRAALAQAERERDEALESIIKLNGALFEADRALLTVAEGYPWSHQGTLAAIAQARLRQPDYVKP